MCAPKSMRWVIAIIKLERAETLERIELVLKESLERESLILPELCSGRKHGVSRDRRSRRDLSERRMSFDSSPRFAYSTPARRHRSRRKLLYRRVAITPD